MFIKENSTVDVIIYYKRKGMHYDCYSEKDFATEVSDEEKESFKKVTIKMKELTWKLYNDLQEGATIYDGEGERRWSYKRYKELRLNTLIVSWDATMEDESGKEVPVRVNEKNIGNLAPEMAEAILNVYDSVMYLGEEEEKK